MQGNTTSRPDLGESREGGVEKEGGLKKKDNLEIAHKKRLLEETGREDERKTVAAYSTVLPPSPSSVQLPPFLHHHQEREKPGPLDQRET